MCCKSAARSPPAPSASPAPASPRWPRQKWIICCRGWRGSTAAPTCSRNPVPRADPMAEIDNGLLLELDELVPYAHWITPEGMPKRFDTWFFLAAAPPEQLGAHDGKEATDSIWVSPREALEGGNSGRFKLPFPTTRNLIRLGKQDSVKAALEDSRGKPIVTVMPVMTRNHGGRQLRIPLEAGYDGEVFEVGSV